MKKILLLVISITILFSGCSRMTPSVASTVAQMYDTTKTIWVKGQEVVIINSDLLDEKTLTKLNEINEVAKSVDVVVSGGDVVIDNEALQMLDRVQKTKEVIER